MRSSNSELSFQRWDIDEHFAPRRETPLHLGARCRITGSKAEGSLSRYYGQFLADNCIALSSSSMVSHPLRRNDVGENLYQFTR
jgi:hypothetical protein